MSYLRQNLEDVYQSSQLTKQRFAKLFNVHHSTMLYHLSKVEYDINTTNPKFDKYLVFFKKWFPYFDPHTDLLLERTSGEEIKKVIDNIEYHNVSNFTLGDMARINIKYIMKQTGFTQSYLSETLGVSDSCLSLFMSSFGSKIDWRRNGTAWRVKWLIECVVCGSIDTEMDMDGRQIKRRIEKVRETTKIIGFGDRVAI